MKSNLTIIGEMLSSGQDVYMCDDFEEIVIRQSLGDERTITHIKRKGQEERDIDSSAKIVFEACLGGRFISREEYEQY